MPGSGTDTFTLIYTGATWQAGQHANTGRVDYGDFFSTDDAHYFGADPQIAIVKVTVDGTTSGDGLNILTGETIGWKYTVTNVGNVPISNVGVTDSQGVTVTCPKTTLAVDESMTCTASGTAATGDYSNTGTASGSYTDSGGHSRTETATDASSYFGADPQIAIVKVTVDGTTSGDGLNVLTGESIKWRYTVTSVTSNDAYDNRSSIKTCPLG